MDDKEGIKKEYGISDEALDLFNNPFLQETNQQIIDNMLNKSFADSHQYYLKHKDDGNETQPLLEALMSFRNRTNKPRLAQAKETIATVMEEITSTAQGAVGTTQKLFNHATDNAKKFLNDSRESAEKMVKNANQQFTAVGESFTNKSKELADKTINVTQKMTTDIQKKLGDLLDKTCENNTYPSKKKLSDMLDDQDESILFSTENTSQMPTSKPNSILKEEEPVKQTSINKNVQDPTTSLKNTENLVLESISNDTPTTTGRPKVEQNSKSHFFDKCKKSLSAKNLLFKVTPSADIQANFKKRATDMQNAAKNTFNIFRQHNTN